ncbi:MAG TPA: tripartite tricarboxylate transporter substrate binding protein [Burkholderiales bacterium]|jgi:tripartite-type tricarboxylate transporter receptor subunit TctC|nr:tripartite tricarboxylate transporter substrate binding protein [Burkholderiales bacterium]
MRAFHITLLVGAALVAGVAHAQNYPVKAIRLVVPQPPGGGNDVIARMISQKLSVALKQQIAVDNRAGAGGLIGADVAAHSPADGYTLLLGNVATLAIIPNVQKKMPYDPLKDFAPVSLIASAPLLVVVHPSVPVHSIKQLVALARAKPGQLNYASNGVGSSTHLATEMFKMMTKTDLVHVPYKGLGPATTDLLSGQIQLMFSSAVAMMPHVQAKRLRAIAMTGAKRSTAIPDIPTVAESGVPDYESGSWYGILAPTGTPREIIDLLNREIVAAVRSADITDRLVAEAVIPVGNSPAEFAAHIQKEYTRIGNVIRSSGAKFD